MKTCISFCLLLLITVSCSSVRIKHVDQTKRSNDLLTPATAKQKRTSRTDQTLRINNIPDDISRTLKISAMREIYLKTQDRSMLAALSELSWLKAEDYRDSDPAKSLKWYMETIMYSYEYLFCNTTLCFAHAFDPRYAQIREIYNICVGRYVIETRNMMGNIDVHSIALDNSLVSAYPSADGIDPNTYDELFISRELRVRGLANQYEAFGVGSAMTGFRYNDGSQPLDHLYPPEGIPAPITAFISFTSDHPTAEAAPQAWISFYDPRQRDTLNIDGIDVPLAADFTTPYAYLIQNAELRKVGLRGLFNAAKVEDRRGIFLMEPYNPRKIPILMVHGLLSSPLTWLEMTNDIYGDPELRSKYQIWHYLYPTAYPVLYSARAFREDFEQTLRDLDPEDEHPATGEIILLAHSMGGVLCRTLITDSGEALWQSSFYKPIEEMAFSEQEAALLRRTFYFQANPSIKRAIFIAVPHQGSDKTDNLLGRLGNLFLRLPQEFINLTKQIVLKNGPDIKEPLRELFEKGETNSIKTLHSDNPVMQALGNLTIDPSVPVHSIIGNNGKPNKAVIDDGYVPYWSSHLDEAISEIILPYGHDLQTTPESIREIKRILRQHLQEKENR